MGAVQPPLLLCFFARRGEHDEFNRRVLKALPAWAGGSCTRGEKAKASAVDADQQLTGRVHERRVVLFWEGGGWCIFGGEFATKTWSGQVGDP